MKRGFDRIDGDVISGGVFAAKCYCIRVKTVQELNLVRNWLYAGSSKNLKLKCRAKHYVRIQFASWGGIRAVSRTT